MRHEQKNRARLPVFSALTVLIAAGLIAYGNTMNVPFALDDNLGILDNPHVYLKKINPETLIRACFSGPYAQRPLANLSFALNYYFNRLDVTGYHLVNLSLHIINGLLVFLLFQITLRLARNDRYTEDNDEIIKKDNVLAGLAAILWLVHPLHTQSVTYILQRMNVMGATFYLVSLWCYIRGRLIQKKNSGSRRPSWMFFTAAGLAAICAWGSKQNTAALPFFIVLYEWVFLTRSVSRRQYLAGFAVAAAIFGLLALIYLGSAPLKEIDNLYATKQFSMAERLLTQPQIILFYISLVCFPYPDRLNLDHDFPLSLSLLDPPTTLLALTALTLLAISAVPALKKHRLAAWAIIWFLGNLVIESSFVGAELIFEHRLYLPSVFLILTAGSLLQHRLPRPAPFMCIMALAIITCLTWAWQRNQVWQQTLPLWQDTAQKSPQKPRALSNLGAALIARGYYEKGATYCHSALQSADAAHIADACMMADTYGNIGLAYHKLGQSAKSIPYFKKALSLSAEMPGAFLPHIDDTHNSMGIAFASMDAPVNALACLQKSLNIRLQRLGPNHPKTAQAYNNIGYVMQKMGDLDQAIDYFQKAKAIKEDVLGKHSLETADTYNDLGVAWGYKGDYDKATRYLEKALAIRKASSQTPPAEIARSYANLGLAFYQQKQYDQAIAVFHRSLATAPATSTNGRLNAASVYNNMGAAYSHIGNNRLAEKNFQKALMIRNEILGPFHPDTQIIRERLNYVTGLMGLPDDK